MRVYTECPQECAECGSEIRCADCDGPLGDIASNVCAACVAPRPPRGKEEEATR
jgi:hypothetical protein